MAKTKEKRQKKKGRSTQELIGVKSFTKYGLETQKGELLFYLVGPTNISVLSRVNIEIKIRHLRWCCQPSRILRSPVRIPVNALTITKVIYRSAWMRNKFRRCAGF